MDCEDLLEAEKTRCVMLAAGWKETIRQLSEARALLHRQVQIGVPPPIDARIGRHLIEDMKSFLTRYPEAM